MVTTKITEQKYVLYEPFDNNNLLHNIRKSNYDKK